MRRIVVVFSSTITALVLLMAWPTSTNRGGTSLASLAGAGSGAGARLIGATLAVGLAALFALPLVACFGAVFATLLVAAFFEAGAAVCLAVLFLAGVPPFFAAAVATGFFAGLRWRDSPSPTGQASPKRWGSSPVGRRRPELLRPRRPLLTGADAVVAFKTEFVPSETAAAEADEA